jgi:uncharacterized protein YaaR (DUF327 family)
LKVRESLNKSPGIFEVISKEERRVEGGREASFQNQMQRAEEHSGEQRLGEMALKITEQGEKLGKKTDIRELTVYKRMICEFLDEVVNGSMKFSKQSFLDRRGRHKVYALIKKINGELEELTQDLLSQEKDNLRLLQRLDDIRGLILDVIM